jgi:hypothetical protein
MYAGEAVLLFTEFGTCQSSYVGEKKSTRKRWCGISKRLWDAPTQVNVRINNERGDAQNPAHDTGECIGSQVANGGSYSRKEFSK